MTMPLGPFVIPMTEKTPTIDGALEKGEWEDATAFSGFW
jgi:hypothetical protein